MLVPVLDIKMERGHQETKNAEIALVSILHKITNLITSMDFVQSEAVSDTVKPAKYRVFFISEDNEKISNENTYVADNRELSAQKRIFRLRFTFKNKKYDKDKQYYLVVYDEDTGLEQWRHPVMMDIAFADDFGFGFYKKEGRVHRMLMMDQAAEGNREELRRKLRENFDGRIVRKDLTKKIKEGANVPVYVLEFLLGQYCSSDDEEIIEQGVQNVKHILADNFDAPG